MLQLSRPAALSLVSLTAALLCGPFAHADERALAAFEDDAAARETAPLTVLGHRALTQQIVDADRAWTLGDAGDILGWAFRDGRWRPTAVRRVEDTVSIVVNQEWLLAVRRDQSVVRLRLSDLRVERTSSKKLTVACGGTAAWTLSASDTLCLEQHGESPKCTRASVPQGEAMCATSSEGTCLTVRGDTSAHAWCAPRPTPFSGTTSASDRPVITATTSNTRAVAVARTNAPSWMVRTHDGWQSADTASAVVGPPRQTTQRATCLAFDADGGATTCSWYDDAPTLHSAAVHAPLMRDIVQGHDGVYVVFSDGWLRIGNDVSDELVHGSAVHATSLQEGLSRVWANGRVLASGTVDGVARAAVCERRADTWSLHDMALHSGEARPIDSGTGACPLRVDYEERALHVSFGTAAKTYDFSSETLERSDFLAPFYGAIDGALVASGTIARHCPSQSWDVSLRSPRIGDVPLALRSCARAVSTLRWEDAVSPTGGPALLMLSASGSVLHLIDENTLESFVLRLRQPLSPNVRVLRTDDGHWLVADPDTGKALQVTFEGHVVATLDLLVLRHRAWASKGSGVYEDARGDRILATDQGIAINRAGLGPVATRVVDARLAYVRTGHEALWRALRPLL